MVREVNHLPVLEKAENQFRFFDLGESPLSEWL
jgi:hypothetical protein